MVKEELVAGLKNALDRNQSLEAAIKSFVSAGYSEKEVREAADLLKFSVSLTQPSLQQTQMPPSTSQTQFKSLPSVKQEAKPVPLAKEEKEDGRSKVLIIVLIFLIIGVVVSGGLLLLKSFAPGIFEKLLFWKK